MNGLIDDLHNTAPLRKMIIEDPDLPLVIFAGQGACDSWHHTSSICTIVEARKGEFLNANVDFSDECFTDRDYFREELEYHYGDADISDAEFDNFIENKMLEYERYWIPCIILEVNN